MKRSKKAKVKADSVEQRGREGGREGVRHERMAQTPTCRGLTRKEGRRTEERSLQRSKRRKDKAAAIARERREIGRAHV